jgi:hypothetical protein
MMHANNNPKKSRAEPMEIEAHIVREGNTGVSHILRTAHF